MATTRAAPASIDKRVERAPGLRPAQHRRVLSHQARESAAHPVDRDVVDQDQLCGRRARPHQHVSLNASPYRSARGPPSAPRRRRGDLGMGRVAYIRQAISTPTTTTPSVIAVRIQTGAS